jgi:glycosyltransferase involved in cell wall biosynthesis
MLGAMRAASDASVDIQPLDPWSRDVDFNVLHIWGLDMQHVNTVRWAQDSGINVVISALLPYQTWRSRIRHCASYVGGPARFRKTILRAAKMITVVNRLQADYAIRILGMHANRIAVIPNIVADIYFEREAADADSPNPGIDVREYVLCTGNICRRKNQLALVMACRSLGVPLLLIGSVLPGEKHYGDEVATAVAQSSQMRWIEELPPDSEGMATAYRRCLAFALPSHLEQQPIAALEAVACGKPLLLADRPYAYQEFYSGARLVEPKSVDSIIAGLRAILMKPMDFLVAQETLDVCRRERVGKSYADVYSAALGVS